MFNPGDHVFGKYRILNVLKPGSFGHVYIVENYGIGRVSVLKIVLAANPTSLKELIEAYSQNLCQHENILKILASEIIDLGNGTAPSPAIAMELEYVQDGSLQDRLEQGYLSLKQSVVLIKDTLHALEFAHAKNIIHGDVKPNNMFIGTRGARLADFGLAKNANLAGAPRANNTFYVSHGAPELFNGSEIDRQTDVFAAGITLYRAVNNLADWHTYVTSADPSGAKMKNGTLISDIGYRPEVPTKLRKIINKACAADQSKRYQSCAEFRQALESLYFSSEWERISPTEWVSDVPGRNEQLTLKTGSRYSVEYKMNGRKKQAHCATFDSMKEAEDYFYMFLKQHTIE